ncbi:hypothetical protein Psta_1638 [Pirellula staleyi DSM 6068]|uniref:Uncharacterized protein n=1 Tax=Pirellula staleyi (strain ATCC 27377 / DSM 6068 / ICPB 4128) TaxID=530564 RepID=D2QY99_PIRSD|nr:hypothetical protein [Pirellula staleyi]ADB16313.1 hypothetical protein Psta_1638 [Pirellula staleyi DSM 6068]
MAKSKNKLSAKSLSPKSGSSNASVAKSSGDVAGDATAIRSIVGSPALLGISVVLFATWFVFLTVVAFWG